MPRRKTTKAIEELEDLLGELLGEEEPVHVASLISKNRLVEKFCKAQCRDPVTETVDRQCVEECLRSFSDLIEI